MTQNQKLQVWLQSEESFTTNVLFCLGNTLKLVLLSHTLIPTQNYVQRSTPVYSILTNLSIGFWNVSPTQQVSLVELD